MPGFTLSCDFRRESPPDPAAFENSLTGSLVLPADEIDLLWTEQDVQLGYAGYPEYPRLIRDESDWRVYLEGRVHNRDPGDAIAVMSQLVQRAAEGDQRARNELTDWLLDTDGEFVAIFLHKARRRVFILNDVFARLPVYYCATPDVVVLSRNLRTARTLAEAREFDRLSIAHYLLWGYYTQQRTYLKDVHRLPPASLVGIDPQARTCSIEPLYVFDFSVKHAGPDVAENGRRLATLFADACERRADAGGANLVSLSGGLDSRSVAAGLRLRGVDFRTSSFIDFERARSFDLDAGAQIASLFDVPRQVFELGPPTASDMLTALRLKNGLNYLGVSFLMQYFHALRNEHGRSIRYFSGNGGDRLGQCFRPNTDFQQVDQLVQYLVNRRRLFSLDQIAALTRTDRRQILESVVEHVRSFPEQDLNQKLVHAELYGDGMSRHLEGEDRVRSFFWTASPFWSMPFFREIMGVADEQKRMFRLYRSFLRALSPEAAAIVYPNVNAPIGSLRHRAFVLSKDLRWYLGRFRRRTPQYAHSPELLACMRTQLTQCPAIGDWLSAPAINGVLEQPERHKHEAMETLFTVMSLIELLESGTSTLESLGDQPLGAASGAWEWFKHKPFRASG